MLLVHWKTFKGLHEVVMSCSGHFVENAWEAGPAIEREKLVHGPLEYLMGGG